LTRFALALAAATLIPTLAHARDVAGVDFPDTMSVEGKTLKCNGAGLRKKFVVKVYAGALYLENNSSSAADILKTDQVRVVQMQFLRDVDKGKIIDAYKDGFEKNSKGDMGKLQPALDKLNAGLGDMKNGKQMTVRYVPGKGVTVSQQGGASVTIDTDAKIVADALLRNWIGSEPADSNLKTAMLSGK
jgi:hypothetical protein